MRLLGLLPPNGTGALFAIVFIFYFIAAVLGLSGFIIVSSMMADVVEDAAVATGQRSEGLFVRRQRPDIEMRPPESALSFPD